MEHTSEDLDMTEWVVVGLSGGTKFLGRVVLCSHERLIEVVQAALNGNVLTLNPAFDFFSPVQQEGSSLHRSPLVMPVDFAVGGVPVHIQPVFAYLCADMHERDRNEYKGFVEQALALAKSTIQQRDEGDGSGGITH